MSIHLLPLSGRINSKTNNRTGTKLEFEPQGQLLVSMAWQEQKWHGMRFWDLQAFYCMTKEYNVSGMETGWVSCSTAHTKQITRFLHDLPWSLWSVTVFMVTGNTDEEGTLLHRFAQWLVFCKAPPTSFQVGLSKAFNNGLFLQQNKLIGTFTTVFSEHLTKVNKKLQF